MGDSLAHLNAALNAVCASFLVAGWFAIRRRDERRHRFCMISAFACSVAFLTSYLTRIALTGTHVYPGEGWLRGVYLSILSSHVVLAALVPWLALRTLYLGLRRRLESHRRWARVTLPIWIYVSVTGVVVYWMLYHHAGV